MHNYPAATTDVDVVVDPDVVIIMIHSTTRVHVIKMIFVTTNHMGGKNEYIQCVQHTRIQINLIGKSLNLTDEQNYE